MTPWLIALALAGALLAGVGTAPAAPAAPAADDKADDRPDGAPAEERKEVADPVVVTATMVEGPASQTGATVTVLTAEELGALDQFQVQEALRDVPGVEIKRFGGLGKGGSIRIRGSDAKQVQVLVDGMRVKSPSAGFAELSELALDGIDRIEIVRGPQSTLHGADAIAGVVNIITRKGQGPLEATVGVEAGSHWTVREYASVQGAWSGFNLNVGASRYDTAGTLRRFDNDDSDLTSVNARVGYDFPWRGELSVTARYAKLNADIPIHLTGPPIVFDPNSQQHNETWQVTTTYTQKILDWWEVTLRYGEWWNTVTNQDPPPPADDAFFSFTDSQTENRRREAAIVTSLHAPGWNTFTLGAEHRHESSFSRTFQEAPFMGPPRQSFGGAFDTASLFAQDQIRLGGRLFVTGGVRVDDHEKFGTSVTGRVAVALAITETGTRLRAAWGQGFRAPTTDELFFPGFGNPALHPEESESWEAGVEQALWRNRLRLAATWFRTDFSDLIQSTFVGVSPQAPFGFLPFNVGSARTQGFEASVELEPVDWLLLHANYTYTDAIDLATDRELPGRPRHLWNTGVRVTPLAALSLFLQAHVASSQVVSQSQPRLSGFHRLDAGGAYRLLARKGWLDQLELTLRIENVTDNRYDEIQGFPAPGVSALVGLRARLR
jgi:vitamin B12 transporter